MTAARQRLGAHGERRAARCYEDRGWQVVARNWRCRDGELDVVARDGQALVFCEVKTRTGTGFGHPAEAVTASKRRRLRSLPKDADVVAYCRGPYCVYADDAVRELSRRGYRARRLVDGFPEWKRAGLPVAAETGGDTDG